MIELFLSSDGKHTVHASASTPEQLAKLTSSAKALYEQVLGSYGTQAQMWREATRAGGRDAPKAHAQSEAPEAALEADPPRCPVHGREMVLRQGRFGAFWSCPTRQFNGSWCQVTREVSEPDDEPEAE